MSLLKYSAIATKVRLMSRNLYNEDDYLSLSSCTTVQECLDNLCETHSYSSLFEDVSDKDIHRSEIENKLTLSLYNDFAKLYRFANQEQRAFLKICFINYEVRILKKLLRRLIREETHQNHSDETLFHPFLADHASFDLAGIMSATRIEEFVEILRPTRFYKTLSPIVQTKNQTIELHDYEIALDSTCFYTIWKTKDKHLSNADKKTITHTWGTTIDLLNLQWIYRAKQYYNLPSDLITSIILPINYRLSKDDMVSLINADTILDFNERLIQTKYHGLLDSVAALQFEEMSKTLRNEIYGKESRKNPYSVAILNHYLHKKEDEIQNITTIIEGVRYGVAIIKGRRIS